MTLFDDSFAPEQTLASPTCAPRSLGDIDVGKVVLENLALKILYLSGSISVLELAEKMRIGYEVSVELFYRLRADLMCQASGMVANIPQMSITTQGRSRASDLLAQSHYMGPAPVSLKSYVQQVRCQSVLDVEVHP